MGAALMIPNFIQPDQPVDWKEVLLDLRRRGWRLSDVALALNLPRSTVGKWMYCGSEPHYEAGRALLKLRDEVEKRHGDAADRGAGVQPRRT